mgnify:CR=1 FL=1
MPEDDLDRNKNILTYDNALMHWGQPSAVTQGEDIMIVTWSSEKTGSVFLPIGKMMVAAPVSHGWRLDLTFNKYSKKMIYWKYDEW